MKKRNNVVNFYEGCTLEEIKAFRELESEVFDFGDGKMRIEGWYGSEDTYYKMALQEDDYRFCHTETRYGENVKDNRKYRPNKYTRKMIGKSRLLRLHNYGIWYSTINHGSHISRDYISKRGNTTYVKRCSNKKVRQYKAGISNGGCYRKIFDYWWEVL